MTSLAEYLKNAPKVMIQNIARYIEKSKDSIEEYVNTKQAECVFAPAYYDCWIDFDIYDDTLWIKTAFSGNPLQTKEAWEEFKDMARQMGCEKIQFTTRRDGVVWERLFDDMKVVQWKIEVEL